MIAQRELDSDDAMCGFLGLVRAGWHGAHYPRASLFRRVAFDRKGHPPPRKKQIKAPAAVVIARTAGKVFCDWRVQISAMPSRASRG